MATKLDRKILVSVNLTARTEEAIAKEARRLGLSFSDLVRRITDPWAEDWHTKQQKPAERIVVLDRETGALRHAR